MEKLSAEITTAIKADKVSTSLEDADAKRDELIRQLGTLLAGYGAIPLAARFQVTVAPPQCVAELHRLKPSHAFHRQIVATKIARILARHFAPQFLRHLVLRHIKRRDPPQDVAPRHCSASPSLRGFPFGMCHSQSERSPRSVREKSLPLLLPL